MNLKDFKALPNTRVVNGAIVLEHPVIQHKLSILRDYRTGNKEFRECVDEIGLLMAYEVTRDLKTNSIEVETPLAHTKGVTISSDSITIVPILRAGLGMVSGVLKIFPTARVGHAGVYRNPDTMQPVEYYFKMPKDIANSMVLLIDPMLATGGSASWAIAKLLSLGVKDIRLISIISAPEGIEKVAKHFPDVPIFTAAVDEKLNSHGYIIPGLGDAGDRLYGTK